MSCTRCCRNAFAAGDKVVLRGSGTAICQDPGCGADATGKPTKWMYISILRFADGKVAELWNNFDALTSLHEVGAASLP